MLAVCISAVRQAGDALPAPAAVLADETPPPVTEPTATPTPEAVTVPEPQSTRVLEQVNDGNLYNGYWWHGFWIPGLPTYGTQFLRLPEVVKGSAVFYAPEVMEANIEYRGLSTVGTVGAVAVPFCSEIGHWVWLQRPGEAWEGPFVVVDCSRRNDLYGHIVYGRQVVEVDFPTAVRWGMARTGGDQNGGRWSTILGRLDGVILSKSPPLQRGSLPVDLADWFLRRVEFADRLADDGRAVNYRPPEKYPAWLINGRWVVFP